MMKPFEHLCGFKEDLDLLVANITIAKNQFSQNSLSLTSTIINQSINQSKDQSLNQKSKSKALGASSKKNGDNNNGGPLACKAGYNIDTCAHVPQNLLP